ncbi:MAG: hypothetical protein K0U47_00020 [Epsilonproteobacteria bacterium]|nr:hypothetical protein [Campylobacterota bacterium]
MKKAIVLLMTIGFIAIISALVLISLSISKKSFDQAVALDAQNQFSVVFKDFVEILKTNSKSVKKETDLDIFLGFSMPPMIEPKTGVEVGFLLESQMGKLNINYMLARMVAADTNSSLQDERTHFQEVLERYFEQYGIDDRIRMVNLLLDTVDEEPDPIERGAYTEIVAEDFDFRQGKIYSFAHLKKIFAHYYKNSYDVNVYKIDQDTWEETFYYGDSNISKKTFLDCNQFDFTPTVDLLTNNAYLGQVVDYCDEANQSNTDLSNLKKFYNISSFDNNNSYLIKCSIIFNTENFKRNVTFDYEVTTAEINNIDKNFQDE